MISKIKTLNELIPLVEDHKKNGRKVVFTNGCFDILHAGHVRYLSQAKEEGDVLIIGLNSDASVKGVKGDKKPVITQDQRSEVLAALYFVDYIIIFDEPDPLNLVNAIMPDVLVKGADWEEADIIGAKEVGAEGGRVARIPLLEGVSTTIIINRIVERFG